MPPQGFKSSVREGAFCSGPGSLCVMASSFFGPFAPAKHTRAHTDARSGLGSCEDAFSCQDEQLGEIRRSFTERHDTSEGWASVTGVQDVQ